MKKILLTILIVVASLTLSMASEIEQLKGAITSQLLSDNSNTALVKGLAQRYFPNGVETDQCLMEVVAYALPSDQEVEQLLQTMQSDGSWSDIDYLSPARSAWVGRKHIKRLLDITRCYKAPSSKYCGDEEVFDAIVRAITYWCDGEFECVNWWYNTIGVPKEFAPVLLLLEGDISPELMARGIKILEPAEMEATGQNKVWLNGVTFIKGLLLQDTSILERASEAIRSELRLSRAEGVQYDYSFHQHGAMQQFGNYGLAFASSQSYWMRVFSGTSYDFTDEQKEIMRGYMTKGIDVTVWRGYMDVSSCGRQLFFNSQAGKAASLLLSNLNMLDVDKEEAQSYQDYATRNYITPDKNNLKGNICFPISKYTVHRADDFMFSVKMFSRRIIGGEITNNENLKGYHLADGATMIYRNGQEYDNIFAVWDGKYMPGTTVEDNDEPLKTIKGSLYLNGSDFAGGLSQGMYGVSALEYRRDGVSANKSWFFLDDMVLCLGSSITAESGDPLITTLNQCNYQEGAYYGSKSTPVVMGESYRAERVFCDGVGYESLDGAEIEFVAREQEGDWHDVALFLPSATVRGDVFTAQIRHKADELGSYAYAVYPAMDCSRFLKGKYNKSYSIIEHNRDITAIELNGRDLVLVVFWRAGTVESTDFGRIKSTAPVMAIISKDRGEVVVECYDPTENGAEVTVTPRSK